MVIRSDKLEAVVIRFNGCTIYSICYDSSFVPYVAMYRVLLSLKHCLIELLNDYKIELQYHEGKANVVAYALSRKVSHAMRYVMVLSDDFSQEFQKMCLEILHEIRVKQREVEFLQGVRVAVSEVRAKGFDVGPDDERDRRVFESLPDLSEGQVRTSETWWSTATFGDSHVEIGFDFDIFRHGSVESLEELANAYQREIIHLHGISKDIISKRDSRLCSQFWKKLQMALGSELKMSTSFHATTDGQTERTI
ncbi:uncharacterized protein LOC141651503 [Silene latifolia]|uniref:uncharacterized protein LOC141651503 n=1 Tax=Silene latifolia TaxID=37657 RepID=UPI003D7851D5